MRQGSRNSATGGAPASSVSDVGFGGPGRPEPFSDTHTDDPAAPERTPLEHEARAPEVGQTPRQRFVRRFKRQPVGIAAAVVLASIVAAALTAPLIAPYDPFEVGVGRPLQGPSADHLLGTDDIGRDVLSRILFATRLSLQAAAQAVVLAVALGLPLGMISGFFGGWLDLAIMRVNDAVMSIPALILALAIIGVLGPSLTNAMMAIGVVFAPRILRVTRATTLAVSEEPYVEAARSIGARPLRILRTHVLPNIMSPLVVQVTLTSGIAILAEAALSFLGLGAQLPQASLGAMVNRAFSYMQLAPVYVFAPAAVVVVMVLSLNLLGDAIRDSIGREIRE